MFAVVETGGKQYRVQIGDVIKAEKLDAQVGTIIDLNNVLLVDDQFDHAKLVNSKVTAEILEQKKSDKVIVFKKKRRHNYRRKRGHRQEITVMRIKDIIS